MIRGNTTSINIAFPFGECCNTEKVQKEVIAPNKLASTNIKIAISSKGMFNLLVKH